MTPHSDSWRTLRRRRMKERIELVAAWLIVAALTVLAVAAWATWLAEG